MKIYASRHFEERRKLREIPENLPEQILREADEHYRDQATGHSIAVKRILFQDKERDIALIYSREQNEIILLTLHPLKEGQWKNRVESRRWIPYEPESIL